MHLYLCEMCVFFGCLVPLQPGHIFVFHTVHFMICINPFFFVEFIFAISSCFIGLAVIAHVVMAVSLKNIFLNFYLFVKHFFANVAHLQ